MIEGRGYRLQATDTGLGIQNTEYRVPHEETRETVFGSWTVEGLVWDSWRLVDI